MLIAQCTVGIVQSYLLFNSASINRSIQSFHWIKKRIVSLLRRLRFECVARLEYITAFLLNSSGALLISLNLFLLSINNILTNGNAKRPFELTMIRVSISFAKKIIKRIIKHSNSESISSIQVYCDPFCSFVHFKALKRDRPTESKSSSNVIK